MKNPAAGNGGALKEQITKQDDLLRSVPAGPDTSRRTLKRARRVIGAALAQRDLDPEIIIAAELICEAGGRR